MRLTVNPNICWLLMLFLFSPLISQDEFEQFLESELKKIEEYNKTQQKAFEEYLNRTWEKLRAMELPQPDPVPKPDDIPIFKRLPAPEKEVKKVVDLSAEKPFPKREITPPSMPELVSPKPGYIKKTKIVSFMGIDLEFSLDEAYPLHIQHPVNNSVIKKFWREMNESNWQSLIGELNAVKKHYNMNDWIYGQLVETLGNSIYGSSEEEIILFTWFILLHSGYDAKVGYGNNQVVLLINSKQLLYGYPFVSYGDETAKYFIMRFSEEEPWSGGSFYVYPGQLEGASQQCDFHISSLSQIPVNLVRIVREFEYEDTRYKIETQVNTIVIDLLRWHPLLEVGEYFKNPGDSDTQMQLLASLRPLVGSDSQIDATEKLLRFTQTAFEYQTDDQQFGREKPMIPDETLFYPFSDCEDRAILFAYLTKHLVNLPVIGLKYPGHVATAVQFTGSMQGDFVVYKGEKYVICDPTYINSSVGASMPKYKNGNPEVISLEE